MQMLLIFFIMAYMRNLDISLGTTASRGDEYSDIDLIRWLLFIINGKRG